MVVFDSAAIYIKTAKTHLDKIKKIDAIIDALENTALDAAANSDVTEYSLDDGQTKIKTMYRSSTEIIKAIQSYEQLKQMYVNRLNGRMVRLMDGKSFVNRNNFR